MTFHKRSTVLIIVGTFVILVSTFTIFLHQQQSRQNKVYGKNYEIVPSVANEETDPFKNRLGFPIRLEIPSIDVDTGIQHVGLNSEGEMGVPDSIDISGWFALGPRPGEKGSAVIAGHLYGENGEPGIFANLSKVKVGDKIYVQDSKGNSISFSVKSQSKYDPGFAPGVFNGTDYPYLNLVTCDGYWDAKKNTYSKRLIVFAEVD